MLEQYKEMNERGGAVIENSTWLIFLKCEIVPHNVQKSCIIACRRGSANMYRILIIEDDRSIASSIRDFMSGWGYEAECLSDFNDVIPQFSAFSPQLVLLDIGLPGKSGFYWCAEIRKISKVPIMFISSAGDDMNIVVAMNTGADDFIIKPFDLNVLVSKAQALLRRTYEFEHSSELIEHGGVVLNTGNANVYYEGNSVELTRNEYRILHTLMERRGRIVSRDNIMRALWEDDSYIDDNTLTVNIARLRKKLEEAGVSGFIQTKKGEGYMV